MTAPAKRDPDPDVVLEESLYGLRVTVDVQIRLAPAPFADVARPAVYLVNGERVSREDLQAIVAVSRAISADAGANALGNQDDVTGIVGALAILREALDPDIEDTFARRLLEKLQLLAEVAEGR